MRENSRPLKPARMHIWLFCFWLGLIRGIEWGKERKVDLEKRKVSFSYSGFKILNKK